MKFALLCAAVVPSLGHVMHHRNHHVMAAGEHHLSGKEHGAIHLEQTPNKKKEKKSQNGEFLLGVLLWCVCPIFIWNNERISVKQAKMRFKAERYAVHIDDPQREPLKELNGRIVYVSGESTCSEKLTDDKLSRVTAEGKIKLRRAVEMFQWVETSHEEGDDDNKRTVYTYSQEWRDSHMAVSHDESKQNPPMPIPSTRRQEPYRVHCLSGHGDDCVAAAHTNVRLGAYYLSDYVTRELQAWKDKEDLTPEMLNLNGKEPQQDGQWWYYGREVGDIRVRFEELHTGPLTICGILCECSNGWSFAPIISKDAYGTCDSLCVECGDCCCLSREELHFGDLKDDDCLLQALETMPRELDKATITSFAHADTMSITAHDPENMATEDLCCVGPFGSAVVKLMHWIGLEDELLAVAEERKSLSQTIKMEESDMNSKINMLRYGSLAGLCCGSWCILSPILGFLNYNIWVSMFGGALLSCLLCCCGMVCSCAAWMAITSVAWLKHRPMMGILGLLVSFSMVVGVCMLAARFQEEHSHGKGGSMPMPGTTVMIALRGAAQHLWH